MNPPIIPLLVLALAMIAPVHAEPAAMPPVVRKALLTAVLAPARNLARVEIKEVTLAAHVAGGAHLHPCPVVGIVTAGRIAFQVEGEPLRQLGPGDAFYEPANVRIAHFDNATAAPATFTAFYLLSENDREFIRLLPQ